MKGPVEPPEISYWEGRERDGVIEVETADGDAPIRKLHSVSLSDVAGGWPSDGWNVRSHQLTREQFALLVAELEMVGSFEQKALTYLSGGGEDGEDRNTRVHTVLFFDWWCRGAAGIFTIFTRPRSWTSINVPNAGRHMEESSDLASSSRANVYIET
jgi:hypothetical protein